MTNAVPAQAKLVKMQPRGRDRVFTHGKAAPFPSEAMLGNAFLTYKRLIETGTGEFQSPSVGQAPGKGRASSA